MASTLKHLRSSTANKRPTASGLADGQFAINTASGTPGVFFKDSNGGVVKVGPAHVGAAAPNAVPAGSAGNSLGELWVDNSLTTAGLKYYTGSTFVNLTPSGTETTVGLVELATPAETQAGTDAIRAVTPSGLQSKVSDSTSTTSSTTIASSTAVKAAYDLANAALPKAGGTITGELLIGTTGSLVFEGSSDDTFETTIAVVNPTADRTITFPNVTGTVITTGDTGTITSTMILDGTITGTDVASGTITSTNIADSTIVNADINASAAIAHSKLASMTAGQILLGNATNVPTSTAVTGDVTISSTGVTAIAAGVIVDADINASAAIADTKLATISTAGKVSNSATTATSANTASAIVARDASGNFSAGTITASLTGAASSNVLKAGDLMTGALGITAGTAAAPGLYVSGDTNTGIYSPGADSVAISTNGSNRLHIDSTGKVGIGTTSPQQNLVIYNGSSDSSYTQYVNNTTGAAGSNGLLVGIASDETGLVWMQDNSPLRFGTNNNERARIDTSGRLLVGTSSESGNSLMTVRGNTGGATGAGVLDIGLGTTRPGSAGTVLGVIRFTSTSNTSSNYHYASIYAETDGTSTSDTDIPGRLVFSTTADGASSPTERMRIQSGGALGLFAGATTNSFSLGSAAAAGTTYAFIRAEPSSTGVFSGVAATFLVYTNGNVQNTNNSYGSISDIKLKENIVDATSQWSDIKALQIRKYNFKAGQTHTQIGLIAQEAELVSPGLVYETPDRDAEGNDLGTVTKSVNYSVLYMKAVKALQEAMERIETLEAKVAALESA